MEFDQLRTFLAIVEHGSFSRAASALHFSQSTLSFHIRSLENSVGVPLLTRSRNGCRPTAAGERLHDYAQRLLQLRDEASRTVADLAQGVAGTLSLAVSTVPGEYLLPAVLGAFRQRHPEVRIEMRQSDSHLALSSVFSHQCSIAIVGSQPPDGELERHSLRDDEILLVGHPTLVQPSSDTDQQAPVTPPTPQAMTLILREPGSGTRGALGDLITTWHGIFGTPTPSFIVGSTESARRCALQGLGWAFISRLAVQDDLDRGTLVPYDLPGLPLRRTFWAAALPTELTSNPVAARFFDFIVQYFR